MAIYNLNIGTRSFGAVEKYNYNSREGKFSKGKKSEELIYKSSKNLPLFSKNTPSFFWECADKFERIGGNRYRKIEFSLPHELNDEENIKLSNQFAEELLGKNYVYSLAIHKKNENNIHCHLIFSERKLDGIERNKEIFFKQPNFGGLRKERSWGKKSSYYMIREKWEKILNEELKKHNIEIVSCKSLCDQKTSAIQEKNYIKAEFLEREPVSINGYILKKDLNNRKLLDYEKEELNKYYIKKEIREIKNEVYKIKLENFNEENQKLMEIYNPSEKENFEKLNFFLEEKVLVEKLEKALIKIQNNKEEPVLEKIAVQAVSNGMYYKNLNEYNLLILEKEKLEKSFLKLNSAKTERYNELKNYINNFDLSKEIQLKIEKKKQYIFENYRKAEMKIKNNLSRMELIKVNDNYINEISIEDRENYINLIYEELTNDFNRKKIIDNLVSNMKNELNNNSSILIKENEEIKNKINKISKEIINYQKIGIPVNSKKEQLNNFKNIILENNKIIENKNIINANLKIKYKKLRIEQDSLQGKININMDKIKKLKELGILIKKDILFENKNKKISKVKNNITNDNFKKGSLNIKTGKDNERDNENEI